MKSTAEKVLPNGFDGQKALFLDSIIIAKIEEEFK